MTAVRTTCPYCGVGCGVLATALPDGSATIAGDPDHPANFGRLCSKGLALGETLSLDGRLLHPTVRGRRTGWNTALDLVAEKFSAAIRDHGPDSVAFYVSGQILTEDYYVANKLMKGFIGSANIDTNSRLCMASSVAGHKRAFGSDTVPGTYTDLEQADLVVLVGSNLAWCHPVLYQRLAEARRTRGTKVVVIDPRVTATTEIADLHLAIAPGSDVALFNGLLAHLDDRRAIDLMFVERHTSGFDAALAVAREMPRAAIARRTGLMDTDIAAFFELFASTERVVTVYSQGVNQSSAGTDKVNAILNCHLATGRIGRPGMGPFSVTGQPNAMGGRETGGLANMLAAHMELADPGHRRIVQDFWRSPAIADKPGLKAVDLFRAVGDGRIKVLWIMSTNPVDSLPQADDVAAALRACPFVVVSDVLRHTDTTALADVLLPAAAWGEKDGTVTNSERRISRQRAILPPPGEARPDWWHMAEVARRMGHTEAFTYAGPHEIYAEYARLTAEQNGGTRDLDIGAHGAIDAAAYDALEPFQWPRPAAAAEPETRFFAEGGFYTPDRRARLVPTPYRPPASAVSDAYPLVLNTGRIRDQWHTMTRSARSPRLMSNAAEPYLEIHPRDAAQVGLLPAHLATVDSARGSAILRVLLSARVQPGTVFVPMHWTDRLASRARIDALVEANCDPVSGQPELKHSVVRATPFAASWYGFAVSTRGWDPGPSGPPHGLIANEGTAPIRGDSCGDRGPSGRPHGLVAAEERAGLKARGPGEDSRFTFPVDYWAIAPVRGGWKAELAAAREPADWTVFVRGLLGGEGELLAYADARAGERRFAIFDGRRLLGALFVAPEPVAVARSWLAEQLAPDAADEANRLRVLAGRPGGAEREKGPVVCACFEVGANQIAEAVTSGGCTSVEAVGALLKAGTNCGSCRAEIRRIVHADRLPKAG